MKSMSTFRRLAMLVTLLLAGCAGEQPAPPKEASLPKPPNDSGRQYIDGFFSRELNFVPRIKSDKPKEFSIFAQQSQEVLSSSKRLRDRYGELYQQLNSWIAAGGDINQLTNYSIASAQMGGADGRGNILFTGYFSPVLEVRHQPDAEFKYPLYAMPRCNSKCPSRAQIHNGALANKGLELGYSKSLIDNFLMDVQGSGFVHYGDDKKLQYLGYAGKNGHPYVSIGKVLINQGEARKEEMSLKFIKEWAQRQPETRVRALVESNPSYVFFERRPTNEVKGAAGVPLLALGAVAADKRLLPMGTPILAEVPLLDKEGNWTGQHQLRLLIALDTGGAVKKGHLDLYHGLGEEAGIAAGHYKHFGRVWKLGLTQGETAAPWVYNEEL